MARTMNRSRLVQRTVGPLAASLLALAAPGVAAAQSVEETPPAGGIELTGYVGALTPLARLADSGDTIRAELSTKVALGIELDYWFGGGFGIGFSGGYARPDLIFQIAEGDVGFPTAVDLGSTDYWSAFGQIMWRPQLGGSASIVRPYFAAGGGVVSLQYPGGGDFAIADETRFAGSVAGGAQIEISGGWFARLDVRDYISTFDTEPFAESKLQNDLVTSIGIGYDFH